MNVKRSKQGFTKGKYGVIKKNSPEGWDVNNLLEGLERVDVSKRSNVLPSKHAASVMLPTAEVYSSDTPDTTDYFRNPFKRDVITDEGELNRRASNELERKSQEELLQQKSQDHYDKTGVYIPAEEWVDITPIEDQSYLMMDVFDPGLLALGRGAVKGLARTGMRVVKKSGEKIASSVIARKKAKSVATDIYEKRMVDIFENKAALPTPKPMRSVASYKKSLEKVNRFLKRDLNAYELRGGKTHDGPAHVRRLLEKKREAIEENLYKAKLYEKREGEYAFSKLFSKAQKERQTEQMLTLPEASGERYVIEAFTPEGAIGKQVAKRDGAVPINFLKTYAKSPKATPLEQEIIQEVLESPISAGQKRISYNTLLDYAERKTVPLQPLNPKNLKLVVASFGYSSIGYYSYNIIDKGVRLMKVGKDVGKNFRFRVHFPNGDFHSRYFVSKESPNTLTIAEAQSDFFRINKISKKEVTDLYIEVAEKSKTQKGREELSRTLKRLRENEGVKLNTERMNSDSVEMSIDELASLNTRLIYAKDPEEIGFLETRIEQEEGFLSFKYREYIKDEPFNRKRFYDLKERLTKREEKLYHILEIYEEQGRHSFSMNMVMNKYPNLNSKNYKQILNKAIQKEKYIYKKVGRQVLENKKRNNIKKLDFLRDELSKSGFVVSELRSLGGLFSEEIPHVYRMAKNKDVRLLQDNIKLAVSKDKSTVRYPTAETAAKIQGNKNKGMLKHYSNFPKTFKKAKVKGELKIVTDLKGNSWYEFDVPESYKKGTQILKAYAQGGSIKNKPLYKVIKS